MACAKLVRVVVVGMILLLVRERARIRLDCHIGPIYTHRERRNSISMAPIRECMAYVPVVVAHAVHRVVSPSRARRSLLHFSRCKMLCMRVRTNMGVHMHAWGLHTAL